MLLHFYLLNFNSLLNPHNVLIVLETYGVKVKFFKFNNYLIILFVCDRLKDISGILVRHLKR